MAQTEPESLVLEDASNSLLKNNRCCFCFPCFGNYSGNSNSTAGGIAFWERIRTCNSQKIQFQSCEDSLWSRAFQKIREWSEIVAGPRWKTFIRRFNRNRSGGGAANNRHGKFQYDPLSYALNFDEGPGGGQSGNFDEEEDCPGFRAFSTRYASVQGKAAPAPAASPLEIAKDVAVLG